MVKDQTTLTFYGGVNEIGGNKILLQNKDTRGFFDLACHFRKKTVLFATVSFSKKREKPPRTRYPAPNQRIQV
jgi:hypothetical protein